MSLLSLLIEFQRKLLINLSFGGDKRPQNRPSFLSKTGKRVMLGTTEHAQTCIEVTEESFCYLFLHFIKCLFTTRFSKFQEALDFVPLHSLCSMWPLRLLSIYTGCDCPSLHGSVSSYRQPCLTELPFSVVSLRAPFFSHSENPTPGLHL